jgi:hypothetical protein
VIDPALFSSSSVEWGTPRELFTPLYEAFKFTLDACAMPGRQLLSRYFAPKTQAAWEAAHHYGMPVGWDSLAYSWLATDKSTFANPPFGRAIGGFIRHAALDSKHYPDGTIVVLLPARTDTAWWQKHIRPVYEGRQLGEVFFLRGRVTYLQPGKQKNAAPFPSVLVRYGPGPDFATVLRGSGFE